MQIIPIHTPRLNLNENLNDHLVEALFTSELSLLENDILVISSKIVSFAEGRVVEVKNNIEFEELVKRESEKYFKGSVVDLSYKFGLWIANAGIDKSNVESGKVVLWPINPQESADTIRSFLVKHFRLKNLGVILVDSICQPGRRGVTGAALAYSGIIGVTDERGKKDLYGNTLKITKANKADMISAAANLLMGEANEAIPYCIVRQVEIEFLGKKVDSIAELSMPLEDCIFNAIYK
jgi:coenzyme F420-0:L-glutamate ligase